VVGVFGVLGRVKGSYRAIEQSSRGVVGASNSSSGKHVPVPMPVYTLCAACLAFFASKAVSASEPSCPNISSPGAVRCAAKFMFWRWSAASWAA